MKIFYGAQRCTDEKVFQLEKYLAWTLNIIPENHGWILNGAGSATPQYGTLEN